MVISGLLLVISLYGAYTLTIFSKYFSSVFSILSFAFRVDVYFSSFLLIVIFAFSFCVHTYYGSFVFPGSIFCRLVSILCVYGDYVVYKVRLLCFRNPFL